MHQGDLFVTDQIPTMDPYAALKESTDPAWVEDALPVWNDPLRLRLYLRDLEVLMLDEQSVPSSLRVPWAEHTIRGMKDTIRVVKLRINQLVH